MADPFSITTGVVTLMGVCITVCVELKKLRAGIKDSNSTVTAMLADVKALRVILVSMEDSFEDLDSGPQPTGHIGTHLNHIRNSLKDGHCSLQKVETLLVSANKEVGFMDATRRHIRMKSVSDQLANYRQEVQVYKDALQLSLQTITLYALPRGYNYEPNTIYYCTKSHANTTNSFNQSMIKEDTAKLLANTDAIHDDIGRLATNLDVKLQALERHFLSTDRENCIDSVVNLRDCVRSAATVISSSCTIQTEAITETPNGQSSLYSAESGGLSSNYESNDFTLSWINSLDWLSQSQVFGSQSNLGLEDPRVQADGSASALGRRSVFQRLVASNDPRSRVSVSPHGAADESTDRNLTDANDIRQEGANEASGTHPPVIEVTGARASGESLSKPRSVSLRSLFFRRTKAPDTRGKDSPQVPGPDKQLSPGKYPVQTSVQRKFVFVGDGACGKTCFLM
ncbi:hypothetical protein jhhlp_007731 [Lomentospora prolificans]|uniref:Fungal N-terminal domain-containing protein n=1 Tax=Lomentospora prolificans TaxID=41688 RepID=A0A2N3N0F0_9PEZI|nr:hypothetical protein jhhlp_007731 [Lomentospora prolificans]